MKAMTGATPLAALEAVAVDTETTGLETATARVVQLGAVAISRCTVPDADGFDTLVDPRMAIPPASTAIHGIDDAMVSEAPAFAPAWASFEAYRDGRPMIGHSIGFDLAVLAAEAGRSGLPWKAPRTLCVRLLGAIANPNLPDQSLDALAAWLGVTVTGRHSAVGDARTAADVFVALVPRLAARGIRTLAEAERASLRLTGLVEAQHRAGWAEPVTHPETPPSFGNIDPFAYRHRVAALMQAPVVAIAATSTLAEAIGLMTQRRISSLFVSDDGEPGGHVEHYGIVTERDVMRRIAAEGAAALERPAGSVAVRPLQTIAAGAFAYRAIGRMDRLQIRHLAVRDEKDRLAGVISARDLLRLRAGAAIRLDDAIAKAGTPEEMAQAWATLPSVAEALIGEEIEARIVSAIVSEELRVATRRAAELAEARMLAEGAGVPPCPYALLVLGSGGRGESLLAADQDNAIVFAEGEPDGPQDRWFARLGTHLSDILDATGIPYCKGGVMARNAAWRGTPALWQARIDDWVSRSRPADLLNVDIFFDLRPVHGEAAMGEALFEAAHAAGGARPTFTAALGTHLGEPAGLVTLFGRIRSEGGRIDLKRHGLFPLVAAARALAIRYGVRRRSTRGRLRGVVAAGHGNAEEFARLTAAHDLLLTLMLAQQSRDLAAGLPVSNRVELSALTAGQTAELRAALRALATLPDMVRSMMMR